MAIGRNWMVGIVCVAAMLLAAPRVSAAAPIPPEPPSPTVPQGPAEPSQPVEPSASAPAKPAAPATPEEPGASSREESKPESTAAVSSTVDSPPPVSTVDPVPQPQEQSAVQNTIDTPTAPVVITVSGGGNWSMAGSAAVAVALLVVMVQCARITISFYWTEDGEEKQRRYTKLFHKLHDSQGMTLDLTAGDMLEYLPVATVTVRFGVFHRRRFYGEEIAFQFAGREYETILPDKEQYRQQKGVSFPGKVFVKPTGDTSE